MDGLLRLILRRLIREGNVRVTTANSTKFTLGDGTGTPVAVRFASRDWQVAVALDPKFRVGEAYMSGGLLVEAGSIADLLDIAVKNINRLRSNPLSTPVKLLRSLTHRLFSDNTLRRSRCNAAYHYDIDYRIYRLFLDSDMQYSCAYFEHEDDSLEEAQAAKRRHIASKLFLGDGMSVLDVGSGWGGLALYLARSAGVSVTGINLSKQQVKIARRRALDERL